MIILKRPGERTGAEDAGRARGHGSREHFRRRSGVRIAGPIVIICAILAVLVTADYWMNSGKVYYGVEVGGVSLGGKSPEQARDIVQDRASGALKEVSLSGPRDFTFTARQMGVDYDVDATVEKAYSVGRSGNVFQRLSDRVEAATGTIDVEPSVDYNSSQARQRVEAIASRLDAKSQEAGVRIVGSQVAVADSAEGYKTDVDGTMRLVDAAVDDMSGTAKIKGEALTPELTNSEAEVAARKARSAMDGQLVLTVPGQSGQQWTVSPAAIGDALEITTKGGDFQVNLDRSAMQNDLSSVYGALSQKAVEADYQVSGTDVSVTPSQVGSSIQTNKLLGAIEGGIFEGKRDYEIPVVVQKPQLTTAEAQQMKPTTLLGSYSTNYLTYDDSNGRIKNLQTGSKAVDGQLVAPGEVFSFNDLASQYNYSSGKVIVDGKVEVADGGGLCQVASTLYMAANRAGIDVIERHPHYAELPYIRPGFDATVWFGSADMKFQNNTNGYVLVKESVDTSTGDVESQVYGVPQDVQVKMSSKQVGTAAGGQTDWVTYQKVSRDGKVVQSGVLHEDTYKPLGE